MATDLANLQTARSALIATLADISQNPKISYSLDGQSFSWTDYYRMLTSQIAALNELIQIEQSPIELATVGRSD